MHQIQFQLGLEELTLLPEDL